MTIFLSPQVLLPVDKLPACFVAKGEGVEHGEQVPQPHSWLPRNGEQLAFIGRLAARPYHDEDGNFRRYYS